MIVTKDPTFLLNIAVEEPAWSNIARKDVNKEDFKRHIQSLAELGDILCVQWHDGGWLFNRVGPTTWEAHTMFRKRHDNVTKKAELAKYHMFMYQGATELVSKMPMDIDGISAFAVDACGFRIRYRMEGTFARPDGRRPTMLYVGLTVEEWLPTSEALIVYGQIFHETLMEQTGHVDHDPNPAHDAYVGLVAASAFTELRNYPDFSGRTEHAVEVYNTWARFCGFELLNIEYTDRPSIIVGFGDVAVEAYLNEDGDEKLTITEG